MSIKGIEFFFSPDGSETSIRQNGKYRDLLPSESEVIKALDFGFETRFPEAHKAATELYNHLPNYKYLRVLRLVKCNWGNSDDTLDIDYEGNWNFEKVHCPLRNGFCPYEDIICNPKEDLGLTERELEVVRLITKSDNEIATILCRSKFTIQNHIMNIKRKLNLNSKGEILDYAHKHNILK